MKTLNQVCLQSWTEDSGLEIASYASFFIGPVDLEVLEGFAHKIIPIVCPGR